MTGALLLDLCTVLVHPIDYDQRIRREGYDVERLIEAAGLAQPLIAASAPAPAGGAVFSEEPLA